MTSGVTRPEAITGGCLCGAIRYTITIGQNPEIEWPPIYSGTCQCTKCRKFTGGLKHESCTFPLSAISPPFTTHPSYTLYASSEKGRRGFCNICGSSLTFTNEGSPRCEILFGSVDEEILKSKVGTELCALNGHLWVANAVKGVTDDLKGEIWMGDYGKSEKVVRNPV
ncbi:Mss4-like protein [Bisporella sp. PMI_857]|nr:Mss4-like protein [Bisporella sp. PMI_857]